jgi:hypothetical protein
MTLNGCVAPTLTDGALGSTASCRSAVTLTCTESATRPDVATTVVAPTVNAETLPALSIVAVCGLRETQVTLAFGITAPDEFVTVAVRDPRPPTFSANDVGAMVTLLAVRGDGPSGSLPHPIVASATTAMPSAAVTPCALAMLDLLAGIPQYSCPHAQPRCTIDQVGLGRTGRRQTMSGLAVRRAARLVRCRLARKGRAEAPDMSMPS